MTWTPDPELVERCGDAIDAWCERNHWWGARRAVAAPALTAAVASGRLVPREQVDELIAAVTAYEAWWDRDCDTIPYDVVQQRMASALARITQEPDDA